MLAIGGKHDLKSLGVGARGYRVALPVALQRWMPLRENLSGKRPSIGAKARPEAASRRHLASVFCQPRQSSRNARHRFRERSKSCKRWPHHRACRHRPATRHHGAHDSTRSHPDGPGRSAMARHHRIATSP
ncbi:hypothetical protein ATSB10_06500 [Dyella thiooxydans]|uniref:Uncharacterized protein n=1 Tax=Dyella thiooxydans TaxID=445710 RepID=A0A160MYF8_9GAMM|nr:hypothetical protein ATSB10_06500 [Dyella thiooxydans]